MKKEKGFAFNGNMKKIICFLIVTFAVTAFIPAGENVYICISKTAGKYHFNRQCRGLKQCTHTIEEVTLQDAKKRGYTFCGFED